MIWFISLSDAFFEKQPYDFGVGLLFFLKKQEVVDDLETSQMTEMMEI